MVHLPAAERELRELKRDCAASAKHEIIRALRARGMSVEDIPNGPLISVRLPNETAPRTFKVQVREVF